MSREIRRLHRKQNSFTNFSGSQSGEPLSEADSSKHGSALSSSQTPRRRRRRRIDSSTNIEDILSTTNPTEFTEQIPSDDSQAMTPSQLNNSDLNAIRAELQEDAYHSELAPSDFSDDQYDWGGDSPEISHDYWHFVGSFE